MIKIITVVGARPNFLKIDPELKQTILHTGQHYSFNMSESFFGELKLKKPKWNLKCKGNDVGKMIDKMRPIFKKEKPDLVIVIGDTHSTVAGAMAAVYEGIKVAHVESGLRSHDMQMPEEINRVIVDRISTIKFCPNAESENNLKKEGIRNGVYIVGDPSLDTFLRFIPIPKGKDYKKFILLTLHRNFNADNVKVIKEIFSAIAESGERVIFPIHPRTEKNIKAFKIKIPRNIEVIKPQTYKGILQLISDAKKVITDSGGIQREASWMNTPVIILRDETEWKEIITSGAGILVGNNKERILEAIRSFSTLMVGAPMHGANKRIRDILYKYL
jgi:UDP-N-acetylglucosamine 2-epimerase